MAKGLGIPDSKTQVVVETMLEVHNCLEYICNVQHYNFS